MPKEEIDIQIAETHATAKRKEFKTGRKGYGFYGKVIIYGKHHQVSLNVVELDG